MESSSSTSKSKLPEKVLETLHLGLKYGFDDGVLDLYNANLDDSMMPELCEWVAKLGDKVEIIGLKFNKITSKGASLLCDTLRKSKSVISSLDLSANQLDDDCMKALGELVQDNQHLKGIDLRENKITDKGVGILSEHLIGNTALKVLDLNNNKGITDLSVPTLIQTARNSAIPNILIYHTSISGENKTKIQQSCAIPAEKRGIPEKSKSKAKSGENE